MTAGGPVVGVVSPGEMGSALGASLRRGGARVLATLAGELTRREGRYALETMCIGGGQGLAAVFERVA